MKRIQTLVANLVFGASSMVVAEQNADTPTWLFVQTAADFTLDGDQLNIPFEREIFAFTDRPNREYGYLNAHELEALWHTGEDNFADNPPNAVLTWMTDGKIQEAEIVLIAVKAEDLGRSVSYTIQWEAGEIIPVIADNVSLFIDGGFYDPEYNWRHCC